MTTIDPRATEAAKTAYDKASFDSFRHYADNRHELAAALSAAQPFMVREGLTQDRLDKLSDDIAEAVQWWQIKGPKDREWKGIMGFVQGVIDKIPVASPPPSADEVERLKQACDALGDSAAHRAVQTDSSPCLICDLITAARAAIAAMNRAPQRSYEDGLRRAAQKVRQFKETHSRDLEFALTQVEKFILAELLPNNPAPSPSELTQPQGEGR